MLVLFVVLSFFQRQKLDDVVNTSTLLASETQLTSSQYNLPLYRNWIDNIDADLITQLPSSFDANQYQGQIIGDDFLAYSEILTTDDFDQVYLVDFEQELNISLNHITQSGLYYLDIEYLLADNNVDAVQYQIEINGKSPFYEAQTLILPSSWVFEQDTFTLDRYDNDIQPRSIKEIKWQNTIIQDYKGMYNEPFLFYLEPNDVMTISYVNSRFLVAEINFTEYEAPNTYEAFLNRYSNATKHDTMVQVSARDMAVRNDPSIRLRVEQDPSNLYYSTQQLRLNTILETLGNLVVKQLRMMLKLKKLVYTNYHLNIVNIY